MDQDALVSKKRSLVTLQPNSENHEMSFSHNHSQMILDALDVPKNNVKNNNGSESSIDILKE